MSQTESRSNESPQNEDTQRNSDNGRTTALNALFQILQITQGDLDQAERLVQLIARLSLGSSNSVLSPATQSGPASTHTSVGMNTSAAAAASSAGVAATSVAPNAAATATAVPPSLLTVGSTSTSTAVPFGDATTIPAGVTVNLGVTANTVQSPAEPEKQSSANTGQASEAEVLRGGQGSKRVQFNVSSQPLSPGTYSAVPQYDTSSQVQESVSPLPYPAAILSNPQTAAPLHPLKSNPVEESSVLLDQLKLRYWMGTRAPEPEPVSDNVQEVIAATTPPPEPDPVPEANTSRQRPTVAEADVPPPSPPERRKEHRVPYRYRTDQRATSSDIMKAGGEDSDDINAENQELRELNVALTQQCRAWERIAKLSISLATTEYNADIGHMLQAPPD